MSLFNTLKTQVSCLSCGAVTLQNIQFKYGDTYQHEYSLGDEILWSNSQPNNDWGCASDEHVVVEGLGEKCSTCLGSFPVFDIFVRKNVIEKVKNHSDEFDFSQDNVVVLGEF